MGSKKRKKPAKRRQGLSGNPAVRAEQIEQERALSGEPGALMDALGEGLGTDELRELIDSMSSLSRALEGNPEPSEWWAQSHERVLERARSADWPADPLGIEETTCAIIGAQLADNFSSHDTGHHNTPWLLALTEHVEEALSGDAGELADWRPLWALLRGLVLTIPASVLDAEGVEAAGALAERGLAEGEWPVPEAMPSGTPLVARDSYGCRFLVAAPFGYSGGETDHWYAWDVDACWVTTVVAAGTFGSPDEALAEWRSAAGSPASGAGFEPCGAGFEPCGARLAGLLLRDCLDSSPMADMPVGGEPAELLREYFRSRRRAQVLASEGMTSSGAGDDAEGRERKVRNEFRKWHADRHGERVAEVPQAAETIIGEWGPHQFLAEDDLFYGCSPHRVEYAAHLISDGYLEDYAARAIRLLPDWVQWCASRGGLSDEDASRVVDVSRTVAESAEAKGASAIPDPSAEGGVFRRGE